MSCCFTGAGNLTHEPDGLRQAGDTSVITFRMAFNTRRGKKQKTCYIDCQAWGKQAEIVSTYAKKGDKLFIVGTLDLDEWTDKVTGNRRSKHIVNIDNLNFISTGRKESDQEPDFNEAGDVPF